MTDARDWIGQSTSQDKVDMETIARSLAPEAAALAAILKSDKISGLLGIRREASTVAANAQKRFKRLSLAAVVGGAIATLASGLLLYGAGSQVTPSNPNPAQAATAGPPSRPAAPTPQATTAPAPAGTEQALVDWVSRNQTAIVVIQILGLFVSAVAAGVLASSKQVDVWAENRNKAELLRREVFNEALKQAQEMQPTLLPVPNPGNPISQCLEFFRRYQHELQIGYYNTGASRHGQAAMVLTWLTAVLSGLSVIAGVVGGLKGLAVVISAFLGIAVPILLAAAQSWRATSRDTDKAASYAKAKAALERSLLDIGDVRKKAATGDAAAVRAYFDSVHLVMTTENDAWKPAGPP